MAQEYFVLSLKYSQNSDFLVWWRPQDAGYTAAIDNAGRYTEEQINAPGSMRNDGINTLAVPCEVAEGLAHQIVSRDHLNTLTQPAAKAQDAQG